MRILFSFIALYAISYNYVTAQEKNFEQWSSKAREQTQSVPVAGALTVEAFGAIGNGNADDTQAFRTAFTYARDHDLSVINLSSGKKYKISNNIDVDYRGQGQLERRGLQLNGNGASIFLSVKNGNNGYFAFNILTDDRPQQNTKFNINNVWFYTDNVNRPNGIYNSHACFTTINNCVFYQLGTAINFQYAGMCRFDNCYFWGCVDGIKTYRCKDSYIDGCHAFACDKAFTIEGVNNAGSDGNICVVNSVANSSTQYNLRMKGLYTPMIANCVLEQSPMNLFVESCQFGKLSNVFSGPGNIAFVSTGSDLTNDYWNIANLDAQGKIELGGLKFSNVTGFKVHGVGSANNEANAAIQLSNCDEVNFTALTIRDSRDQLAWSMAFAPNCSSITISNLNADRSILMKGSSSQRPGRFFLTGSIINGIVITEDKQYKASEIFEYIDSGSNTFHSNKPNNH
ncbi:hypothetical protein HH214_17625 [Mucilaginibacter robiniae]|uniref:Pectate lyase superfamily protein domain-containing protein n=1 Tax=Mucilaginibacter robiniae TaxID=2728022 RepID=A0A7L5E9L3_9SPHI|nr:hypothetical protein [Mucilaginibacter robiniae]QJD97563.1 hypothetical protein HH214_17625 [Mucilaginibacter robiniae]